MKKIPSKRLDEICDYQLFTSSSTYQRGKDKIINDFPSKKRGEIRKVFNHLEKHFINQGLWYQHTDLHQNNVINGNYIIDWDTSSYYPYNYDLGTIYSWKILDMIKEDQTNWELFKESVLDINNGERDMNLEFSLFLHFARFASDFNFSMQRKVCLKK